MFRLDWHHLIGYIELTFVSNLRIIASFKNIILLEKKTKAAEFVKRKQLVTAITTDSCSFLISTVNCLQQSTANFVASHRS